MKVSEYMKKHGLTDEKLDAMAAPYESGDYTSEDGKVYTGSHIDSVGKRRVTVVYNAADTQRVASIARSKGVKPAVIYREALDRYLATV
ncbi:hypothetical protein [Bifidobacterium catenulatum]|jgi:hypothetical protein|uniref:Uncharacterized protein n=1 Tax=Bifidobacterium catenulatum subsp. kashiwanohense TaxID=630129 RepID=A0AA43P516_9BIFI|nr:hypothetical protein [Bifidobacterium catenulatum]MDH7889121.1 hypothetical protein [Bifidobacterium catenulatum subsp. kashiwanohense]